MDSERMGRILEKAALKFNQLFGIVPHGFVVPRAYGFDTMNYMMQIAVKVRVTGKSQRLSGCGFYHAEIPDNQLVLILRIKKKPCWHFVRFRFHDNDEIELITQLIDGYRIPPAKKVPPRIEQIKALFAK